MTKVPYEIIEFVLDEVSNDNIRFIWSTDERDGDFITSKYYFFYQEKYLCLATSRDNSDDGWIETWDWRQNPPEYVKCREVDEIEIMFERLTLDDFTRIVNEYPDYFFTDSMGESLPK